jgi:hypothetical protein
MSKRLYYLVQWYDPKGFSVIKDSLLTIDEENEATYNDEHGLRYKGIHLFKGTKDKCLKEYKSRNLNGKPNVIEESKVLKSLNCVFLFILI